MNSEAKVIIFGLLIMFGLHYLIPTKKEIKEAIKEKIENEVGENENISALDLIFGGQTVTDFLGSEMFDTFLNTTIKPQKYIVLSLIYFQMPGQKKHLIGIGILKTPIFFGSIKDWIEKGEEVDEKETNEENSDNKTGNADGNEGQITEPPAEKEVTESEIITDLKENRIANLLASGRELNHTILKGDLNQDGNQDYIVTYCLVATDKDRDAGGGNALANMMCVNEGMVIYLVKPKTGTSFSSIHYDTDKFYNVKEYVKPNTVSFNINRINDDGTIVCNTTGYKDDDPRCCPSDEAQINLKLISNSDGTVRFEKE
jgi:hypothetical protein